MTVAASAPDPAEAADGPTIRNILVIGDSLEVGAGPYLENALGHIPHSIDALTSRSSAVGLELLRSGLQPSHDVVVFDLGVNDDPGQPEAFAARLAEVRSIIGDRCLVIGTMVRPPYAGVTIDAMNRVVQSVAAASPLTQLFDWNGQVRRRPDLVGADGVHAAGDGYAIRGGLVATAIAACPAPGTLVDDAPPEQPPPPSPEPPPEQEPLPPPGPDVPASLFRAVGHAVVEVSDFIAGSRERGAS